MRINTDDLNVNGAENRPFRRCVNERKSNGTVHRELVAGLDLPGTTGRSCLATAPWMPWAQAFWRAYEVVMDRVDRDQLADMAQQARQAMGIEDLTVLADRGYFKGEQILGCTNAGITPLVPKTLTSNSRAEGCFDKQDSIYVAADDEYRCPAGERAISRFTTVERGLTIHKYWSSACPRCPIKAQCTPVPIGGSPDGTTRS